MTDERIGVIGAGTMGSGIAVVAAMAGFETRLHDLEEERVERGLEFARDFIDRGVAKGKLSASEAEGALRRLHGTTRSEDLAETTIVIEAIVEDLAAKRDLLARLDAIIGPDALIHTNTSTLSVTAIASGSSRPERVIGTHYCNPAPLMSLVEIAEGRFTSSATSARTRSFVQAAGKKIVLTKDRPGFILNRLLIPWENSCIAALEAGLASRDDIDKAVKGALGHPMGPFQLLDIVGLDIHQQVAMRLYEQLRDPRFFPPPMVERMVAANTLGRKTGVGFYEYDSTALFGAAA